MTATLWWDSLLAALALHGRAPAVVYCKQFQTPHACPRTRGEAVVRLWPSAALLLHPTLGSCLPSYHRCMRLPSTSSQEAAALSIACLTLVKGQKG